MSEDKIQKLNEINISFYKTVAPYFDSSRNYYWKGWRILLENEFLEIHEVKTVLDVGCGNGRFVGFLKESLKEDFKYIGIDSDIFLLEKAKERYPEFDFVLGDIVFELEKHVGVKDAISDFDVVVMFGVLHHIPSFKRRVEVLKTLKEKLSKNGALIISIWNFMEDKKWKDKVSDWKDVDISKSKLEENDYLLPWDRGVKAYRYAHFVSKEEQEKLLEEAGLILLNQFYADGKSGRLNRYIVLESKNI